MQTQEREGPARELQLPLGASMPAAPMQQQQQPMLQQPQANPAAALEAYDMWEENDPNAYFRSLRKKVMYVSVASAACVIFGSFLNFCFKLETDIQVIQMLQNYGIIDKDAPDQKQWNPGFLRMFFGGLPALVFASLLSLCIPAAGYYGAKRLNPNLLCCFCSCSLVSAVLVSIGTVFCLWLMLAGIPMANHWVDVCDAATVCCGPDMKFCNKETGSPLDEFKGQFLDCVLSAHDDYPRNPKFDAFPKLQRGMCKGSAMIVSKCAHIGYTDEQLDHELKHFKERYPKKAGFYRPHPRVRALLAMPESEEEKSRNDLWELFSMLEQKHEGLLDGFSFAEDSAEERKLRGNWDFGGLKKGMEKKLEGAPHPPKEALEGGSEKVKDFFHEHHPDRPLLPGVGTPKEFLDDMHHGPHHPPATVVHGASEGIDGLGLPKDFKLPKFADLNPEGKPVDPHHPPHFGGFGGGHGHGPFGGGHGPHVGGGHHGFPHPPPIHGGPEPMPEDLFSAENKDKAVTGWNKLASKMFGGDGKRDLPPPPPIMDFGKPDTANPSEFWSALKDHQGELVDLAAKADKDKLADISTQELQAWKDVKERKKRWAELKKHHDEPGKFMKDPRHWRPHHGRHHHGDNIDFDSCRINDKAVHVMKVVHDNLPDLTRELEFILAFKVLLAIPAIILGILSSMYGIRLWRKARAGYRPSFFNTGPNMYAPQLQQPMISAPVMVTPRGPVPAPAEPYAVAYPGMYPMMMQGPSGGMPMQPMMMPPQQSAFQNPAGGGNGDYIQPATSPMSQQQTQTV